VVVGGVVFFVVGGVVRGRRLLGAVTGCDGVALGSGAGKLVAAAGSWASALSRGWVVRSTGRIATLASTMLVAVATHQPAIGVHRKDRTEP
jgi:hypothetical protein